MAELIARVKTIVREFGLINGNYMVTTRERMLAHGRVTAPMNMEKMSRSGITKWFLRSMVYVETSFRL